MYSGQPAKGTSGAVFSSQEFRGPAQPIGLSDNGKVLFWAFLEGGDVSWQVNDLGLWVWKDDETELLARLGETRQSA